MGCGNLMATSKNPPRIGAAAVAAEAADKLTLPSGAFSGRHPRTRDRRYRLDRPDRDFGVRRNPIVGINADGFSSCIAYPTSGARTWLLRS